MYYAGFFAQPVPDVQASNLIIYDITDKAALEGQERLAEALLGRKR